MILLGSCQGPKLEYESVDDIRDKSIGVMMGSIHDAWAHKEFPQARVQQYQSIPDMVTGLHSGKVDAIIIYSLGVPDILSKNKDLAILAQDLFFVDVAMGFNKARADLREQFNSFLQQIRADGTYHDIVSRWMERQVYKMPDIAMPADARAVLRVGVVSDLGLPNTVMENNRLIGFEIELAQRFASWLGMNLQLVDLPFGSLLASVSTNKIDMIASSLMVTEERQKQIDFSDPYYESGASIMIRRKAAPKVPQPLITTVDDIRTADIGVVMGSVYDAYAASQFPQARIHQYQNPTDMLTGLSSGKVTAAFVDQSIIKDVLARNPGLEVLAENMAYFDIAAGFSKSQPGLREQFNNFLAQIRNDTIYDDMLRRWMQGQSLVMPDISVKKPVGTLKVGVVSDLGLPHSFVENGKLAGFDIELCARFAAFLGREFQPVAMPFGSLLPSLATHKTDMIAASIFVTEERQKQIDFSEPYHASGASMLIRRQQPAQQQAQGWLHSIARGFHNNIISQQRYRLILDGLLVTLIITVLAALLGTMIGALVCYMRMSSNPILLGFARGFIALIRGTPVLVLLMIIYYVIFAAVNISPVLVAVIAFGINFGAYVSEMFRTSIEGVDRGQREAGIASGFSEVQTFVYIIMPQALRRVLPVYKGEFVSLLKMTSVVGYIAVQDLTRASDIIRSRTFDAFFPLIMAAVIYLLLAWLFISLLDRMEIRVDPLRKPRKSSRKEALS